MDFVDIEEAIGRYQRTTGNAVRPVKAALIDLDGTLYDSMPRHARAWHRMVSELGIASTVDEFFGYEGMTGKATVNLLFERAFGRSVSDEEAAELYHRKTLYFRDDTPAEVMPGAQSMVKTLREHGITPVLVTGTGQRTLLDRLNADFDGAFPEEMRITAHNVKHGKPHPEPYLSGLRLAGVQPDEAIVVENAPLGVRSGVAAGIFTVAVNTGPIPRESLLEAGANIVFDSMPEFAAVLPELIKSRLHYES